MSGTKDPVRTVSLCSEGTRETGAGDRALSRRQMREPEVGPQGKAEGRLAGSRWNQATMGGRFVKSH